MKKFERKDFLKIAGGSVLGGVAGATIAGGPFDALQWAVDWTQDQYTPPNGEERFVQTICDACPDRCNLTVRMIGNRAVKIETVNGGCPVGQNALQLLYHPERIGRPLKRVGSRKGRDRFEPVTWETALSEISGKINEKIEGDKRHLIAGINKSYNLSSNLLDRLVRSLGSNNVYYEQNLDSITNAALGGSVAYDFENTDYILTFGARILEGWGNQKTIHKAFKNWKQRNVKHVHIDTNRTRTGSLADEWIPVKPGSELFLALGIAYVLIREKGKTSAGTGFGRWSSIVNNFPPDVVTKLTGVTAEKIREIATAFNNAARPMAVSGRGGKGISSSSAEITAVYALNSMKRTGAVNLTQQPGLGNPPMSSGATQSAANNEAKKGLDEFIKDGSFEMLFVNGADPVYKSVYGNSLKEKLESAYVVAIGPLKNNTALYADYILPSLSFLEIQSSAGDAVVPPRGQSKHAAQILINLAKSVEEIQGAFPWTNFTDLAGNAGAARNAGGTFSFNSDALNSEKDRLKGLLSTRDNSYPLHLIPAEVAVVGDGDGMAFPYVLKSIDNYTYSYEKSWIPIQFMADGKLWAHMNEQTAEANGISEGESIDIESSRGEIGSIKVHRTNSVAPGVIAVPLGFGHELYTKYGEDKGLNPKEIMNNDIDPLSGTADWWLTRVKLS